MICCNNRSTVSCCLLFILSILLGVISVAVWFFGFAPNVIATLPYAFALSLIILLITSSLISKGRTPSAAADANEQIVRPSFDCVCRYGKCSFFTALATAIIILIGLVTVFTSTTILIILGIIGTVAFWFMVLAFAALITCIINKRCPGC